MEAAKTEFNIGWSIYAGWMPWAYAEKSGILKKWADKYGIKINLIQVNDYVESINQYTAGKLDGVSSTNMDALTIPAAGGKDTTALIIGDFSAGADGVDGVMPRQQVAGEELPAQRARRMPQRVHAGAPATGCRRPPSSR